MDLHFQKCTKMRLLKKHSKLNFHALKKTPQLIQDCGRDTVPYLCAVGGRNKPSSVMQIHIKITKFLYKFMYKGHLTQILRLPVFEP